MIGYHRRCGFFGQTRLKDVTNSRVMKANYVSGLVEVTVELRLRYMHI